MKFLLKRAFLFALIALSFTSCRVTWVPSYDASIVQDITDGAKQTDLLYISMSNNVDKTFNAHALEYAGVEAQINAIILKNQARPKSGEIIKMANNLHSLFLKYADEHRNKRTLNNSEISLYNRYLQALWKPMLVAERALK